MRPIKENFWDNVAKQIQSANHGSTRRPLQNLQTQEGEKECDKNKQTGDQSGKGKMQKQTTTGADIFQPVPGQRSANSRSAPPQNTIKEHARTAHMSTV